MASDRSKIDYAKSYLRSVYAHDLAGLQQLRRQTFSEATDTVTLTSSSFEGGTGSGQIVFEKVLLGIAIEELIPELDPNYVPPASFPRREIGVTVRLGC